MADGKPGRPMTAPSRDINDACPCVRERWQKLVNLLEEEEPKPIFLMTTSVLRTQAQQDAYVEQGTSWTRNSKHLPQPPNGLSLAVDVAPTLLVQQDPKHWAPWHEWWNVLGRNARAVGFEWGVVDSKGRQKDPGHCYLNRCACPPKQSNRADAVVKSLQKEE